MPFLVGHTNTLAEIASPCTFGVLGKKGTGAQQVLLHSVGLLNAIGKCCKMAGGSRFMVLFPAKENNK